jgi:UDP-N-acetylglucosamine 2-epimerase (non-hydrolysing)
VRILVPLGTRPEIIKLAPVVAALRRSGFAVRCVATGQHHDPSLTSVFFERLGLVPDETWALEGRDAERFGGLLTRAYDELDAHRPDLVLLLGDTLTVPLFALAARHARIPIAHIEAGLRSFNPTSVEEVDRKIAATTAALHFAPTEMAARLLTREGIPAHRIRVVGNPVIDAISEMRVVRHPPEQRSGIVLTAHRATNVDDHDRLERLIQLAQQLAAEIGPLTFPLHPRTRNRLEQAGALNALKSPGIRLTQPLAYEEMLSLVARSRLVVTDSGGLQEEASWLGVPVVILRRSTPRWEGVAEGASVLVGLDVEVAIETCRRLTSDEEQRRVFDIPCPYGDGHAGDRIAAVLAGQDAKSLLRIAEPNLIGTRGPGEVRAVLFDLDDTLFSQAAWLDGAWIAVADAAVSYGVDRRAFKDALSRVAAEGSAKGRIIDRALASLGTVGVPIEPLVEAFRSYRAVGLPCYPAVRETLAWLRGMVPIGLVTDGDPDVQRSKLQSVGLEEAFDVVVLSDEFGRAYRKPHPAPFLAALDRLGVAPGAAVHVGDSPEKDVAGATAAGLRAVRVRSGEYANWPGAVAAWATVSTAVEAVDLIIPLLSPPEVATPPALLPTVPASRVADRNDPQLSQQDPAEDLSADELSGAERS